MARTTKPLSDTEVKHAKAKAKEYNLADGQGLSLRISPNGAKSWFFNYYHPLTKKRQKISFGKYPEVTLAKAREKRSEARSNLADNTDPKSHREQELLKQKINAENTFQAVFDNWFNLKKTTVQTSTANKTHQLMTKHVLPFIGAFPISEIRQPDVKAIIQPISNRGNHETVKRLCRHINEVMRMAVAEGLIEVNYIAEITRLFPAPKKQHMPTITPDRLPELMSKLANASITLNTRYLIEWQLHTMTRPNEAASAKWEDIDFDLNLWTIPASQMKMKRAHVIPLSPQAIQLLTYLKSISGHRPYLFPGHRDPKSHVNSSTANVAIKRMGFAGELVAHGLRSLASTTLNEQGFDHDVVEMALAHGDPDKVRSAYNRSQYIEKRRIMMCWWSEHIQRAATGDMSLAGGYRGLRSIK